MIPMVFKTRATVAVDEMTQSGNASAYLGFHGGSKKFVCVGALLFSFYVWTLLVACKAALSIFKSQSF